MKKYLIVTLFSIAVLSGILGYFKVFGSDACDSAFTGEDYIGCEIGVLSKTNYIQNQQIIQLEQQNNKLVAFQICGGITKNDAVDVGYDYPWIPHSEGNYSITYSPLFNWCVSKVLNDTK